MVSCRDVNRLCQMNDLQPNIYRQCLDDHRASLTLCSNEKQNGLHQTHSICRRPQNLSSSNDYFCFDSLENIEGKEENAGLQNFLLFPQWFLQQSFLG